eukprot:TRINITY_DN5704_c0_g1_i6.p1 TRINITY_DN5704_c0_g1~~TRINITY_DN5704_c0_g1_i6.p1  ORF type:complete len:293 (+),score=48.80 TRINITY_DN5704_c0_g1_i6:470-1348(+)
MLTIVTAVSSTQKQERREYEIEDRDIQIMEVNGAAYIRQYLNKSKNGVHKLRENFARRKNEAVHAEELLIQRQSESFTNARCNKKKLGAAAQKPKDKIQNTNQTKKQLVLQILPGVKDRSMKLNASFGRLRGKNDQINFLKQAVDEQQSISPKVQMRCKDGVVLINGGADPVFIPKLNLDKLTSNREIYQPLPIPRRTILSQNDEVFKGIMENKQKSFCNQQLQSKQTSECWSTRSHVPSDQSYLAAQSTTSSEESSSKKKQNFQKKKKNEQWPDFGCEGIKVQKNNTFTKR